MQESKDVLNYEKMHSIDKRRAAIDSRYRAFVTNKAFTDYFEYEHFYTITDFNQLKKGYMKIPEPVTDNIAPKPDIVIVPGLAFTKEGKRIGYGAGFYDRYLKNIDTYKIGVGFNFQIVDELKQHENDINLDTIITNEIV